MNTPSVYHASQEQVVVRQSKDYSKFIIDPINRGIDWEHVERLANSITEKNLLKDFPILVSPDWRVIDGQHRLKAAEWLEVSIYYIVSDAATVNDAANTNALTKRWTAEDYLRRYVSEGRSEYVKLSNFWNEIGKDFVRLSTLKALCYYGDRVGMNRAFNMGNYLCNDVPFARKVLRTVSDFGQYLPFYKDDRFISFVSSLVSNSDYDHKRMMSKLSYLSSKIVKCPDREAYFDKFNEVYNYGQSEKNRMTLKQLSNNDPKYRVDRKMYAD